MGKIDTTHRLIEKIAETLNQVDSPHISPEVCLYLQMEMGFSATAISLLFKTKKTTIDYKLKVAKDREIFVQDQNTGHLVLKDSHDDEFCDMATEDKITYITKKYDQFLTGKAVMSKDQVAALKVRLDDLRKIQAENIQEGKELIVKILNTLMRDYVRDFKSAFDDSFVRLKVDMARVTLDEIWGFVSDVVLAGHGENANKIKDEVANKIQGILNGLGADFDVIEIFNQTGKRYTLLTELIDQYLERAKGPLRVGQGTVADPDAIQGGAQARQRAKEAEREEAAREGLMYNAGDEEDRWNEETFTNISSGI